MLLPRHPSNPNVCCVFLNSSECVRVPVRHCVPTMHRIPHCPQSQLVHCTISPRAFLLGGDRGLCPFATNWGAKRTIVHLDLSSLIPGWLDARMHCARKCRAQNHKLCFEFVKLEQLPRYILCNCDLLALSCSLLGECHAPCIDGCRVASSGCNFVRVSQDACSLAVEKRVMGTSNLDVLIYDLLDGVLGQ